MLLILGHMRFTLYRSTVLLGGFDPMFSCSNHPNKNAVLTFTRELGTSIPMNPALAPILVKNIIQDERLRAQTRTLWPEFYLVLEEWVSKKFSVKATKPC